MKSKFSIWIQSLRCYSFPTSLMPVLITCAFLYRQGKPILIKDVSLIVLGLVALHSGVNLVNDYFDYINGIDTTETSGSSRVLVDKLLTIKELKIGIYAAYFIAVITGAYYSYLYPVPVFFLVLAGGTGGYLYTGKPFAFKYNALGEICVFILMGPLLFIGIHYVLATSYDTSILLLSIPAGLLTTSILSANNLRDIYDDKNAGIMTIATLTGVRFAAFLYLLLIFISFALIVFYIYSNIINIWSLIVFFTIIPVIINLKKTHFIKYDHNKPAKSNIVENTAMIYMIFSLLLSLSMIINV
ncbi:MAG: 1,4-dihydroxy-2-naphthoate octaprenyltransferase [bacterium]|nr:1,4-dihydroxy-2-naphthoate octaprenyltransferase [bacterium]